MSPQMAQSLPVCYALSSIGGILEVGSTAVLALPDARRKEGLEVPSWVSVASLVVNVVMQLLGSIASNLIAPWFGPVSVVAPIYFSSTLVCNLGIFGYVLGLEFFDRSMVVGTYVVAIGTVLLQVVGPGTQDDQDLLQLLGHVYSLAWFLLLQLLMAASACLLLRGIARFAEAQRMAILLTARSTSFTLNLTVSRGFLLSPPRLLLVALVLLKLLSGAIYTYAIVVQATAVTQAKFVPLNAALIIFVNALTGVLIWDDWKVISSWLGYICVFLLLALGCDLLLSANILTNENPHYGTLKRASVLIDHTPIQRFISTSSISSIDPFIIQQLNDIHLTQEHTPEDSPILHSTYNQYPCDYGTDSSFPDNNNNSNNNKPKETPRKKAWRKIIHATIAANSFQSGLHQNYNHPF